jgi:hypothetical protein
MNTFAELMKDALTDQHQFVGFKSEQQAKNKSKSFGRAVGKAWALKDGTFAAVGKPVHLDRVEQPVVMLHGRYKASILATDAFDQDLLAL